MNGYAVSILDTGIKSKPTAQMDKWSVCSVRTKQNQFTSLKLTSESKKMFSVLPSHQALFFLS